MQLAFVLVEPASDHIEALIEALSTAGIPFAVALSDVAPQDPPTYPVVATPDVALDGTYEFE
jgi:hypothetical protein